MEMAIFVFCWAIRNTLLELISSIPFTFLSATTRKLYIIYVICIIFSLAALFLLKDVQSDMSLPQRVNEVISQGHRRRSIIVIGIYFIIIYIL